MILFGRQPLLDALAFARFSLRQSGLQSQLRRTGDSLERERQAVSRDFREYAGDLNNYSALFPNSRLVAEPFDEVTLRVVRDIFGRDVIQGPNVPGNPAAERGAAAQDGALGTPRASHPERDGGPGGAEQPDGEIEYLRTVLERRQRDADSEVKP